MFHTFYLFFQKTDEFENAITLGDNHYWLEDGTQVEDRVYDGLMSSRAALGIKNSEIPRNPVYLVRTFPAQYEREAAAMFTPANDYILLKRTVVSHRLT